MSRSSSESSEMACRQEEGGFVNRLRNIPVVKSAVKQASSIYTKAKEANAMTRISLSFAEMSIKAAVESSKFAYNAVPVPGFVGTLKEEAEKKVVEADALACKGLELLEEKYPAIMSEPQEILSVGTNKIEKSDVIEAALIISEAALDYISPAKKEMNGNVTPRVVSSKKLDRMIDVSRRTGTGIYHGGSKIVWNTATAPWYATKTGINLACQAAVGAAHLTSDVISVIPVLSGLVKPRRKVRRSRRLIQRKPHPKRSTFQVSPEKKRKRSNGENNSDKETLYEMIYVKEYYESDEDPDYCPKEDHLSDSDDGSSDTVGASDEEGDSGEGDEVDISEAGGQSLTAEQAKNRSVKFEGGHIEVHVPQGPLVAENNRSTEIIHILEKEEQKSSQMSETQQGETKDAVSAVDIKKKKGEKSAKSPSELKTTKSPKTRAKDYASAVGKENVPKTSSAEKTTASVISTLKIGDKTKSVKFPDTKDAREANKEGAKDGVPGQAADSSVSQKDDPFGKKGRIIL